MNFFKKLFTKEKKESLDKGLKKSNESFFNKISKAIVGKSKVDDPVSYTHLTLPTNREV